MPSSLNRLRYSLRNLKKGTRAASSSCLVRGPYNIAICASDGEAVDLSTSMISLARVHDTAAGPGCAGPPHLQRLTAFAGSKAMRSPNPITPSTAPAARITRSTSSVRPIDSPASMNPAR